MRGVRDALARLEGDLPEDAVLLVDAVRIPEQIDAIRKSYGARVAHVHVTAPPEVLAERYETRTGGVKELASYEEVRQDPTEQRVRDLEPKADVLIDTDRCTEDDVFVRAASHLGLYGKGIERLVDVLVGGQFGSEGKGNIAAYLSSEYDLLVRVGGPNAGHKVFWDPEPYAFHLLPSGTLHSRADLVIGPGSVISVEQLQKEINDCQVTTARLAIDPRAMVIEPADVMFEEKTLRGSIGSTAQGVGAATARKVLRGAWPDGPPVRLAKEVPELQPYLRETCEVLDNAFTRGARVFLEGTQGSGLSLHHGPYPHVTSRDTTVSGCLSESGIAPSRVRRIVMVCRTFPIRVESPRGKSSGPMSQEISPEVVAERSGISINEIQEIERTTTTDRPRRLGEFDWSLLRTAASLNGPTDVALTFADYLSIENRRARRFEQLTEESIQFIEEVERVGGARVSLISTRFHWRGIIDRRLW